MAQKTIDSNLFTNDIIEFFLCLNKYKVQYVIVGGQAVIFYGHSRLTGDIDFYYNRNKSNCEQLYLALDQFWEGDIPELENADELTKKDLILQFGVPPNRIDLINEIDGLTFDQIWDDREIVHLNLPPNNIEINLIGLDSLIKNKEKAGRPRDLEDLNFLRSVQKKSII